MVVHYQLLKCVLHADVIVVTAINHIWNQSWFWPNPLLETVVPGVYNCE